MVVIVNLLPSPSWRVDDSHERACLVFLPPRQARYFLSIEGWNTHQIVAVHERQLLVWFYVEVLEQIARVVGNVTVSALLWSFIALELFALLSVPSVLLRRRGRPVSALAWLLALFALPALGGLSWWAFGRTRLERKRMHHSAKKRDFQARQRARVAAHPTVFEGLFPPRALGEYAFPSVGNDVKLLCDGTEAFPELLGALARAQQCIHISMYIFALDETGERVLQLLEKRAQEGLEVRLLLDGFGSQKTWKKITARLQASGGTVGVFLPSRLSPIYAPRLNFINHRKLIVIDDELAFTGGMNIANEYAQVWRDLMLRVEGPAVRGLHHVFLEDWFFATEQALPEPATPPPIASGADVAVIASGPDSEPWIHDAYFLALTRASHSVDLATPYFIPSQALLSALRTAAGRGVRIRLILPRDSDVIVVKWASRSYYKPLVDVGVEIYEYDGPMLHAKALVIDGAWASVGTANIDSRSLGLSFEVSCFTSDALVEQKLSTWLERLFADSSLITREVLAEKKTAQKLAESAAHLLSPIL